MNHQIKVARANVERDGGVHDVLTSANRMSTFGFVASVSTRDVPAAAWQSIEMPATRNMARTDHIPLRELHNQLHKEFKKRAGIGYC